MALAEAPEVERQSLQRLLESPSWPRRALAALRLERYRDHASQATIEKLLDDPAWQTRAFAVRALARRGASQRESWFADENEPRVVRAALRHRYAIDPQRLARGIEALGRDGDLSSRLLAVELALPASGGADAKATSNAIEALRTIILRMNRGESGALSGRLAAITGQHDLYTPFHWKRWLGRQPRDLPLDPAFALPERGVAIEPALLASIDAQRFADLEAYISSIDQKPIDLAIVIDCTASMGGELAAAQGGIDNLMLFVRDVVGGLRVGLVAYRDRRDEFETLVFDFDDEIDEARRRLWQLNADGGGDRPEAVYPALQRAFTDLHWDLRHSMVLVLIGDAPPHIGHGGATAELAAKAARMGVITHVVQAKNRAVEHFDAIAREGRGRCVNLEDDAALVGEIAGLTLGDRFTTELRELFAAYLQLCR